MSTPSPRLLPDAPIEVIATRIPFADWSARRQSAASMIRLESTGQLLIAFSQTPGRELGDAVLMLSRSDDDGVTWSRPDAVYAMPGWFCMAMGGLARISDTELRLMLGRIKLDLSLGGTEPMTGWFGASSASHDGGLTWEEHGEEIRLFPHWTELYGASNPHPLSDGRLLWAGMGTKGRDVGWHSGVTFSDAMGEHFEPPVIIAEEEGRDYSDTDVIRLDDGRFLAVSREHLTKQSVLSHSSDEGRTWTPIRPTPFKGSNIKLFRLRSGAVLCAYRDEVPSRRGVGVSVTPDGGETWAYAGQLYAAGDDALHEPGSVCGYPDIVRLSDDRLLAVLHSYPTADDGIRLHLIELRDRS
jgi:hypothetical protein